MQLRAQGLVVAVCVLAGIVAFSGLGAAAGGGPTGARAVSGVVGLAAALAAARVATVGIAVGAHEVVVRNLLATYRLSRADVLGLAFQPVMRGRARRLALVCADGSVLPAGWALARAGDDAWGRRATWAAYGFGPTQAEVEPRLRAAGRLAGVDVLPIASADPGLTPTTVAAVGDPHGAGRWLGWETVFVVAAFALPALAGAISLLAQHLGGVGDLDEFDLPLPHHPGVSLVLLLIGYATTALVVPIALLLLARTGQAPATLGLTRSGFRRDVAGAVGMYAGVWVVNLLAVLAFSPLIDNSRLTNTASNSHVPAYYIVYAVFLSATTAINEEVIVNGYFITRLSQRGWSPGRAFALSLAVRTAYHAYYGLGLLLTIPLGAIVTRSFQKRQRLVRPILVHFVNDVVLLVVAVLTS